MKKIRFRIIKASFIALLMPLSVSINAAQDNDDVAINNATFTYKPTIGGTLRGKFEYEPSIESYRFQVRNARISLKGWVAPIVDYKAEIDLCDEGVIKMLDVYGRVHIENIVSLTLGQMRVPFSVDASRSPYILYFANRSFLAKKVGNVRDVGFKASYTPKQIPLTVEAGIFNGSGLTEQKIWHKEMSYSGKVDYKVGDFKFEIGAESIIPDSVRINLLDGCISWSNNRLSLEGEYMYKHYTNNAFKDVHSYNIMANYDIPLKGTFSKVTIGARFDGMTDHSNGWRDKNKELIINDYARKRLTGGVTLSFIKKFQADLRLNYEQYFYSDNAVIGNSDHSKLVVELMVHF